jgi:hypothetical protein
MKVMLFLMSLVFLTGCFNSKSEYSIVKPKNGKFHSVIMFQTEERQLGEQKIPAGNCTAFVINDTTAITAGHCLNYTETFIEGELKEMIERAKKEVQRLKLMLADLRVNCVGFHCAMQAQQLIIGIQMNERDIKIVKEMKADKLKIFSIDGKDTKIVASALHKGKRRDFGFIKGDFKKFNKVGITPGFNVERGDMLRACGYAGANHPPACVNFKAAGAYGFAYAGESMFVPGMSGGPVFDGNGGVVGIISRMKGSAAIMVPMLGVVQLIGK